MSFKKKIFQVKYKLPFVFSFFSEPYTKIGFSYPYTKSQDCHGQLNSYNEVSDHQKLCNVQMFKEPGRSCIFLLWF